MVRRTFSSLRSLRVIHLCLRSRNTCGHEQLNLVLGICRPFALWNESHSAADGPKLATERRGYAPNEMTMITTRSGQLVEQYRNLCGVRVAQSLHIHSAELNFRGVLTCLTRSLKNLRVVARASQRRIPAVVHKQQ